VLGVALLIFGPKRLPYIGSSMGQGIKEFRKTMREPDEKKSEQELPAREQPAQIAAPKTPETVQASVQAAHDHDVSQAAAGTPEHDAS
jgi:sec-independent protein translocase protein TatA